MTAFSKNIMNGGGFETHKYYRLYFNARYWIVYQKDLAVLLESVSVKYTSEIVTPTVAVVVQLPG